MKKKKSLFIVLSICICFFLLIYGIYILSKYFGAKELEASLEGLQIRFPNSMVNLNEKFGNDLEITCVERWGINITFKNSLEFERKYNVSEKATEDFLQDIANECFECFHDEIAYELNSEYTTFRWPVSISFELEKGNQYEMIGFFYEDFDKCNIVHYDKW